MRMCETLVEYASVDRGTQCGGWEGHPELRANLVMRRGHQLKIDVPAIVVAQKAENECGAAPNIPFVGFARQTAANGTADLCEHSRREQGESEFGRVVDICDSTARVPQDALAHGECVCLVVPHGDGERGDVMVVAQDRSVAGQVVTCHGVHAKLDRGVGVHGAVKCHYANSPAYINVGGQCHVSDVGVDVIVGQREKVVDIHPSLVGGRRAA